MQKQTFHFEVKDLLTQFIAAFDDIVIKRYDKNRVAANDVHVRYVYSPKQRVMFDLVNKAQNITIPVVAVNISKISRDESRVFNKIEGFYYPRSLDGQQSTSLTYKSPVPVNIDISMSILTKFQSDMDQILSNFVPYNNPYIIISWKVPSTLVSGGFEIPQEIRSEVLWSGDIALSYPTDISANEKYKVVADTSFTIKGWLFPADRDPVGNIYYIDANFYNKRLITNFEDLSGDTTTYGNSALLVNETDKVTILGYPQITNVANYDYNVDQEP